MLLTDLAEVTELLELNVQENLGIIEHFEGGRTKAMTWKWGNFKPESNEFFGTAIDQLDFIVISDCIYYEAVCLYSYQRKELIMFKSYISEPSGSLQKPRMVLPSLQAIV